MVTHWLGHLVVSAVVHAVAYGAAFAVFRHMTGTDAVGLAVLVIGVLFVVMPILWFLRRLFFGGRGRRW
ncbi:hypothetical protein HF285_07035 [Acidithiobacillus ferrooxidans F221]|uniref:hypothetical protein n=1 Tax=Acidithiobacillus ferrooxidans TaxID=920 RepID=UPI001C06E897|nr:hypothetical protein [Acidithiobacillus ferrooxidans]MBU2808027.1 hypothetical protein [Acidithiobacillus ferrooxidans F221]